MISKTACTLAALMVRRAQFSNGILSFFCCHKCHDNVTANTIQRVESRLATSHILFQMQFLHSKLNRLPFSRTTPSLQNNHPAVNNRHTGFSFSQLQKRTHQLQNIKRQRTQCMLKQTTTIPASKGYRSAQGSNTARFARAKCIAPQSSLKCIVPRKQICPSPFKNKPTIACMHVLKQAAVSNYLLFF